MQTSFTLKPAPNIDRYGVPRRYSFLYISYQAVSVEYDIGSHILASVLTFIRQKGSFLFSVLPSQCCWSDVQVILPVAILSPQIRAKSRVLRLPVSKIETENPIDELVMSPSHSHYKEDSEYLKKATYQNEENYGPYSSPSSDCNSLPLRYLFIAALATLIVMLVVAALV